MKQILYKLFEHQYLGRDEARTILQNIAQGKYNDVQVASLITVFLMRNISVEELCGFRDALLEMRVPVDLSEFAPIDIVGTGGDGKNTFNISTAACFTVAGAGIPVVKHGNYGATSVSGASNVMEHHRATFACCQRESTPDICDSGAMVREARIVVPTSAPVVMSPFITIKQPTNSTTT